MSDHQTLRLTIDGGVATVLINRPEKLNALSFRTLEELEGVFRGFTDDPAVRGVLISGAGEKAFAAGADIQELADLDGVGAIAASQRGQRAFLAIERCGVPVVAAVNGFALGGGCELALACHLRVASTAARFGLPEVKLGTIPGYGGTVRLARIVGRGRALEMILTGSPVDAQEALRIGLVNRVAEPPELLNASRSLLDSVLANGPVAIRSAIESVIQGAELSGDGAFALESHHFGLLASTRDMHEGVAAFLEKRQADFLGR